MFGVLLYSALNALRAPIHNTFIITLPIGLAKNMYLPKRYTRVYMYSDIPIIVTVCSLPHLVLYELVFSVFIIYCSIFVSQNMRVVMPKKGSREMCIRGVCVCDQIREAQCKTAS